MQSYRRIIQGATIVLAVACSTTLPAASQAGVPEPPGDDYRAGNFGRVRFEENGLTIVRAETGAHREFLSAGYVNTPIFTGDAMATGPNQRAEAQLANSSLVRVDQHSHVVFVALPDPYPEIPDDTVVELRQGGMRIETSWHEPQESLIETPGCRIFVSVDTDVRVAVRGGRTRVATRRGIARVESGGSSLLLRAGMATEATGGASPLAPRPYNSFLADSFDRWVAVRQSLSAAHLGLTPAAEMIRDSLPPQVQPFFRELSLNGNWVENEHFGYAWVPKVPGPDWRPYAVGHWGYGQRGYFWVSHEPWGWAPYHYGRWIWLDSLGWAWVPGHVFGGAWVSWSWGPEHVGWAALDFWNMPVRRSTAKEGVLDLQSWIIVPYEDVARPNVVQHQIRFSGDAKVEILAVVRRTPALAPTSLADPNSRLEAIAAAQEDAVAIPPATTVEQETAARPSFLELERRDASFAAASGRVREETLVSPDDPREAEIQPAQANDTGDANLKVVNSGTVVQGRPAAMRPLVRSEQNGTVGVSERWKAIYHSMGQPRPTQFQNPPARTSPAVLDDQTQSSAPPSAAETSMRRPTKKKRGERTR